MLCRLIPLQIKYFVYCLVTHCVVVPTGWLTQVSCSLKMMARLVVPLIYFIIHQHV